MADIAADRQKAGEPPDAAAIAGSLEQSTGQTGELAAKVFKQGEGLQRVVCTATPFKEVGIEVYGTPNPAIQCTRTIQVSGEDRHMHVECPSVPVAGANRPASVTDDYERMDSKNFRGTQKRQVQWSAEQPAGTITTLIAGKWIAGARPHLPYSPPPTDLEGKKAVGPLAVALLDPFRIVAEFGGEPYTAQRAYILLNFVPQASAKNYGPRLQDALAQIYLHNAVAYKALQLHLELLQPWMNQLHHHGVSPNGNPAIRVLTQTANQLRATGSAPTFDAQNQWEADYALSNSANWLEERLLAARTHADLYQFTVEVLWNAYFSQAKTEAEKEALLGKLRQKYKLVIVDPDFFTSQTIP